MKNKISLDISYFPGCSLATSARENNLSLLDICKKIGVDLIELEDWNCCGSSSAHSLDPELSLYLAYRIFSLAASDRPLLVACPSCNLRLRQAQFQLINNESARKDYERLFAHPFNPDLKIMHFFELFDKINLSHYSERGKNALNGIKFVPYYGCMLARPPYMRQEKSYHGLIENILFSVGAKPVTWSYSARCCGTFLSATKPDIVTAMVNEIVGNAIRAEAECIVTACAMCHLNLEMRCNIKNRIPVFHFSELLALALGSPFRNGWANRHLVDPMPLLKAKDLA